MCFGVLFVQQKPQCRSKPCFKEGFEIIITEGLKEHGLGLAIMERLRKASAPKINLKFDRDEGI